MYDKDVLGQIEIAFKDFDKQKQATVMFTMKVNKVIVSNKV